MNQRQVDEDSLEAESSSDDENDNEKKSLSKPLKIEGIVPKDIESRKEIMSFIAYAQGVETACRLYTWNKNV